MFVRKVLFIFCLILLLKGILLGMNIDNENSVAAKLAKEVVLISQKYAHEKKNAATKRQGEVRAAVTKYNEIANEEET